MAYFNGKKILSVGIPHEVDESAKWHAKADELQAENEALEEEIEELKKTPNYTTELIEGSVSEIENDKALRVNQYSFYYNKNLTSASISNATFLGGRAFYYCSALKRVNLPKVTIVGDYAFHYCSALTEVSLPNATVVYSNSFYYCSALTEVSLPNATRIDDWNFANCDLLSSVDLPLLENVSSQVFRSCKSLVTLSLPSVKTLESNSMQANENLTWIKLPKVTAIKCKFNGCEKLTSLIIGTPNSVCSLSTEMDSRVPITSGEGFIYVPDDLVEQYKVATNWVTYASQIKPLSEYVEE